LIQVPLANLVAAGTLAIPVTRLYQAGARRT
jgi:hypothetical protein